MATGTPYVPSNYEKVMAHGIFRTGQRHAPQTTNGCQTAWLNNCVGLECSMVGNCISGVCQSPSFGCGEDFGGVKYDAGMYPVKALLQNEFALPAGRTLMFGSPSYQFDQFSGLCSPSKFSPTAPFFNDGRYAAYYRLSSQWAYGTQPPLGGSHPAPLSVTGTGSPSSSPYGSHPHLDGHGQRRHPVDHPVRPLPPPRRDPELDPGRDRSGLAAQQRPELDSDLGRRRHLGDHHLGQGRQHAGHPEHLRLRRLLQRGPGPGHDAGPAHRHGHWKPLVVAGGTAVTWTATASGGIPSTTRYALFRRKSGTSSWIPDVTAPAWQSSNVLSWTPTSADLGTWDIIIWVKDGNTSPTQNTYGYAAYYNAGPVQVH